MKPPITKGLPIYGKPQSVASRVWEHDVRNCAADVYDARTAMFEQQVGSCPENAFDPERERLVVFILHGNREAVILVVRMPRDVQRGANPKRG